MPFLERTSAPFRPAKDLAIEYPNFKRGLNLIFKPTELRPDELAQADNSMLVGEGVPTGRWGSDTYNLAGPSGSGRIRFLGSYVQSTASKNLLITLTDAGVLAQKSGASYTEITGSSFMSGTVVSGAQLGGNLYLAGGPSTPLVKFDGTSLLPYVALSTPTNLSATALSGASGFTTWSWRVTANSNVGETIGSLAISLPSLPLDLSKSLIRINWNTVSAASGTLKGYNVYRGFSGDETWLSTVDNLTTSFLDSGQPASDIVFPPTSNTTDGPRARYVLKFDDRIVMAGFDSDPSLVLISGRYPYQDRFNWADGGGFIRIDPDGGDDITGLGIAGSQGSGTESASILIFKTNSVHRISIASSITLGNFSILDPQSQVLTFSNGCSSFKTIVPVENDTFYFGRKGLYVIGQEPNFLNQIRTNELSARIRPYVQALTSTDFGEANAVYIDNKYILSFPTKKESFIYDRERGSFMGPWQTPWGITSWLRYIDSSGNENWLAASDSGPYARYFSSSLIDDSSTVVAKLVRTKKEDFGEWHTFKIIKIFDALFRNVRGAVTVNIRLETKDGNTVTTKSFNLTSSLGIGGWGGDEWGQAKFGNTAATVSLTGDELVRWAQLYKLARVMQVEVQTTAANSNFEFLSIRTTAQSLGDSSLPASTRV